VLDVALRPELDGVPIAHLARADAEVEDDRTLGTRVRRNDIDDPVLARYLRLDGEGTARRALDADRLHRALITLRVLVLEARGASSLPERLAGAAHALREDEALVARIWPQRDDLQDRAPGAAGLRGITDEGGGSVLVLGDARDLTAGRISRLLLHGQRFAQDRLV